jgi:hypothetical protein
VTGVHNRSAASAWPSRTDFHAAERPTDCEQCLEFALSIRKVSPWFRSDTAAMLEAPGRRRPATDYRRRRLLPHAQIRARHQTLTAADPPPDDVRQSSRQHQPAGKRALIWQNLGLWKLQQVYSVWHVNTVALPIGFTRNVARIPIELRHTSRRKTKLLPVIRHLGHASSSGQAYLDR